MTGRILDVTDVDLEWFGGNDIALKILGNDLVHVCGIYYDTGTARMRVFASLAADAPILFEGEADVRLTDADAP